MGQVEANYIDPPNPKEKIQDIFNSIQMQHGTN